MPDKKWENNNANSIRDKNKETERRDDCSRNFREVSTKSKTIGWSVNGKKYFFFKVVKIISQIKIKRKIKIEGKSQKALEINEHRTWRIVTKSIKVSDCWKKKAYIKIRTRRHRNHNGGKSTAPWRGSRRQEENRIHDRVD